VEAELRDDRLDHAGGGHARRGLNQLVEVRVVRLRDHRLLLARHGAEGRDDLAALGDGVEVESPGLLEAPAFVVEHQLVRAHGVPRCDVRQRALNLHLEHVYHVSALDADVDHWDVGARLRVEDDLD